MGQLLNSVMSVGSGVIIFTGHNAENAVGADNGQFSGIGAGAEVQKAKAVWK